MILNKDSNNEKKSTNKKINKEREDLLLRTSETENFHFDKENKEISVNKLYSEVNIEYRQIKKNIYDDLIHTNELNYSEKEININNTFKNDINELDNKDKT